MRQIKTAIFRTGFIGRLHIDAVRRLEGVEVTALSDVVKKAEQREEWDPRRILRRNDRRLRVEELMV